MRWGWDRYGCGGSGRHQAGVGREGRRCGMRGRCSFGLGGRVCGRVWSGGAFLVAQGLMSVLLLNNMNSFPGAFVRLTVGGPSVVSLSSS